MQEKEVMQLVSAVIESGLSIEVITNLIKDFQQGKVYTLPCALGSDIYQLRNKKHRCGAGIVKRTVYTAEIYDDGSYTLIHTGGYDCHERDLGKKWFLNKEEAEKALAKMLSSNK